MAIVENKKEDKKEKKSVKKTDKIVVAENSGIAFKVLAQPWITEKSHAGIQNNKYTFKVARTATKKEVKRAIEGIYNVKVEKITSINIKPKRKSYGRYEAVRSGVRKMTVTLKKGDKIELFQGA